MKGRGTIPGRLLLLQNVKEGTLYPGLVETDTGPERVHGTMFAVLDPTAVFPIMDEYERFTPDLTPGSSREKNYYERKLLEVILDQSGEKIIAEVYILNRESVYFGSGTIQELGLVSSGDWLAYGHTSNPEK